MRILQVVHGLPRGGIENELVNLLNGLPRDEFHQAVVCLDVRGEMADRIDPPVELFEINRKRNDFSAPFRLAKVIREWQPDVIHCRNWNAWMDTVAAHWLAGGKAELVWSFHGFVDAVERAPLRRRLASKLLLPLTGHIFTPCRDAGLRYAQRNGLSTRRFEVVYSGIDCNHYHPLSDPQQRAEQRRELGLDPEAFLMLTTGSLTPIKRHGLLIEVVKAFKKLTNTRFQCLVLGEGGLREELEAKREQAGLEEELLMPGGTDRVADYLAVADVFVLPSRLECLSNAIIEAMATSLPVVCFEVGGNKELVRDDENGYLCANDDVSCFANQLETLVVDPPLRKRLGERGREIALEAFSMAAMMRRYEDYYRRIAE